MNTRERVGAAVKALRESKGWSTEELGVYASLSGATIRNIETGRKGARIDSLEAIARAGGVDVSTLLPEPEEVAS